MADLAADATGQVASQVGPLAGGEPGLWHGEPRIRPRRVRPFENDLAAPGYNRPCL